MEWIALGIFLLVLLRVIDKLYKFFTRGDNGN